MKHTLRFILSFTILLSGILSFAGKKSSDNFACPTATISYVGTPFCSSDTSVKAVTLTGTDAYLGGVFSSTSGLTLNPTTGAITPNTSVPGVYTVTYTIAADGSCPAVNVTTLITILPSNTVSAASSTPTLCINTPLTPITHTVTGATGMGVCIGLPPGLTASWSSGMITITGTPASAGVFNYSAPLTGGCGTVYATGTITVVMAPGNVTISGGTSTCAGTPVSLIVTGTPGAVINWTGSPSTFTIGASGSIFIPVSPTVTTTYNLISASLNSCSNPVVGQSATVTVNQTPQFITQIPDITICNGEMLNIASQLTSTVPGATFIWAASTSNINMAALSGDETNIDQVVNLLNTSTNGVINIEVIPHVGSCSGTSQQILITVSPIPEITSTIADETTICDYQYVPITVYSNSPTTAFNWEVNQLATTGVQLAGGFISGTSTTGFIPTQFLLTNSLVAGTISFDITPVNGICTGSTVYNAITFTVNPIPGLPLSLPTFNICSGESPNLTIAAYPNVAGTISEWEIISSANVTVDIVTPSGSSFPFTINDVLFNTSNTPEQVTYSVTTKLGDCEGGTTNYVVNVLPLPNLSVFIDGEITIDNDGNVTPYVLDTGLDTFNHNFEWYLNNTLIVDATSNTYTASEEGEYSVHVTSVVTNCSNFAIATVTETTIENEELTDLVMFPNPTFDSLSFNNINKVMSIQISNQMGQTILYKDLNSKTGTIDLSDLNVGIYNIVFETESGIVNQRIIKQ